MSDTLLDMLNAEAENAEDSADVIRKAMAEIERPASPSDIATAGNMGQANVRQLLPKMIDDGTVIKCEYGKYDLASTQNQT